MSQFKLPTAVAKNVARIEELERANKLVHAPDAADVSTAPDVVVASVEAPTPEPVVAPQPEIKPAHDEWEHKFKTLQGMFNAEKRRAQEALASAEERNKALENQLVTVEKTIPRKWDIRKYIPADELENYDEKQLETVLKATMSASSEELDTLVKRQIEPLKAELENAKKAANETKREAFIAALEAGCENWEEINRSPKFHAWLSEVDEISGIERQSVLSAAEARLDVKRVLTIFKAFLKAQVVRPDPRDALANKVLPDVSAPTTPSSNAGGGEWFTRSQIRRFYDDCRRGNVYTRAQQDDMERRLQSALSNGRIKD